MEETAVPVTPALETVPPPAAITPAPAEVPAAPALPESRRDVIARAMNGPPRVSNGRQRDASGKFVPVTSDAPAVGTAPPAVTASEFPTPQSAPKPPASMPKSLRLELQQHWDKTPAELQEAINQREAAYEKGVLPLKEKARVADELLNEFKPYQEIMQREGGTPAGAIRDLLRTAMLFRTGSPIQKAHAVAQLMQQFSVSTENLQQVLSGNAPQPGVDPLQVQQLIEQRFSEFQQQQLLEQSNAEVDRFAADPANKHFEAVQDWMMDLISTPRFQSEHLGKTPQEKLKSAYATACRVDPNVSQQIATEQQAAQQTQHQVTQARNAAVQVKGSPSAAPSAKPDQNNRREIIRHAIHATR